MEHGVAKNTSRLHTLWMLPQRRRDLALPDLHGSSLTASEPASIYSGQKKHKRGMASTVACDCDAKDYTAEHIITSWPICHHPIGGRVLSDVNKSLASWLMKTCRAI